MFLDSLAHFAEADFFGEREAMEDPRLGLDDIGEPLVDCSAFVVGRLELIHHPSADLHHKSVSPTDGLCGRFRLDVRSAFFQVDARSVSFLAIPDVDFDASAAT